MKELMHLGAAIGLRLRDGCEIGKSWKGHGDGTLDPQRRDECDPEHPDESKSENLEK